MGTGLFSAYERRQRNKKDPKHQERVKKWSKTYREKYPEKIKEYFSRYDKEMRKLSAEIGNCTYCYKPKEKDKYKMCLICRMKIRRYNDNYYRKKNMIARNEKEQRRDL